MTSEYEADQDLYIEYTYDDGGNVTSWYSSEDPSVEPDWGVDFTYEDPQWKDLLTSYDGEEIEYDAIGNPTTYIGSSTLTWTDGRRLATFENSDYSLSFTYDMDGIRQSKTVNGAKTKYFTSGSTILREERSDGKTLYFYYDDLGNIAALEYNNTMYYYVRNILGEILGLANSSGAYVAKYSYTAYGGVLSITDGNGNDVSGNADHIANINPYRYKGYYYDVETGFYYLNSRYYNPMTARFINADGLVSTGQGFNSYNLFAYCGNNPVVFVDPNGNCPGTLEHIKNNMVGKEYCYIAHTTKDTLNRKKELSQKYHYANSHLTKQEMCDNAEIIYEVLRSKGWSKNAIYAVLGNMEAESALSPGRWQNGVGPGYGLIQWDPASKYLKWAAATGSSSVSILGQIKFLEYSMLPGKGEYFFNSNSAADGYYVDYDVFIRSTASIDYLTQVFFWSYVRASVDRMPERISAAYFWYEYFT